MHTITIDGHFGFFFEGDVPETVAFVPEEAVMLTQQGPRIDQTIYFLSGWAERNMRFSAASCDCKRTFPIENKPVDEKDDLRLNALISRLCRVYKVEGIAQARFE